MRVSLVALMGLVSVVDLGLRFHEMVVWRRSKSTNCFFFISSTQLPGRPDFDAVDVRALQP
jgi:hypothetical protein